MKRYNLQQREHNFKIGMECPDIEPNIHEDTMFFLDGEPVGFFIKRMDEVMIKLATVANREFLSDRVPKQAMHRKKRDPNGGYIILEQISTIIGGIPKKGHLGRHYANLSAVHKSKTARPFVKAMLMLAQLAEGKVKELMPAQYESQVRQLDEAIIPRLRLTKMFTSSISNFNISAPFHRDTGNLKNTVNIIINKKSNATGGNLHVPEYGLTFDGDDNSMVVYPAWMSVHGVTPIHQNSKTGYRNSLVFYPYDLRK